MMYCSSAKACNVQLLVLIIIMYFTYNLFACGMHGKLCSHNLPDLVLLLLDTCSSTIVINCVHVYMYVDLLRTTLG